MNVTLSKAPAPVVWAGDSAEKIVQIPLVALPAHAHQDFSYKVAPKQSARVTHFVAFLKLYFKIVFKVVQNDSTKGKDAYNTGSKIISAAAPKLWNGLPVELRQATSLNSFKSRLKTYLFKKYFYSL